MTRDPEFLRRIIDSPDDLAARLVFADYLEETGRAGRAAFVRADCGPVLPPWRLAQLLAPHGPDWFAGGQVCVPVGKTARVAWPPPATLRADVRRGFIDCVSGTVLDFLTAPPALFRDHPVRGVALRPFAEVRADGYGGWVFDRAEVEWYTDYGHLLLQTADAASQPGLLPRSRHLCRAVLFRTTHARWGTKSEARAALNDALVRAGRRLAENFE